MVPAPTWHRKASGYAWTPPLDSATLGTAVAIRVDESKHLKQGLNLQAQSLLLSTRFHSATQLRQRWSGLAHPMPSEATGRPPSASRIRFYLLYCTFYTCAGDLPGAKGRSAQK